MPSCRFDRLSTIANNVAHTWKYNEHERMADERSASSAYYMTIPGPP
jgi:hypothetical protein